MTPPETNTPPKISSLAVRLAAGLRRVERHSPRTERVLLAVALIVFVGGSWYAWQNIPELDSSPVWWLLAVAAAFALVSLIVNAGEFAIATHLLGRRIRAFGAFHVSVLSSAANALPIPGAVVIKTRALRQQGQGYKKSFSITASIGVMWIAVALLVAAALQLAGAQWAIAGGFAGAGLLTLAFALALLAGAVGRRQTPRASLPVFAIELLSVAVTSARIHVLLLAMGFETEYYQSAALTCAAVIASAVGIFPGGLGLREVLSAATANLVGLDPAVGLLVSVVDRIITFAVFGLVNLLLLLTNASAQAAATTERVSLGAALPSTDEDQASSLDVPAPDVSEVP